jgi:hypothetical protein
VLVFAREPARKFVVTPDLVAGPQYKDAKNQESRTLRWDPPSIDGPVRGGDLSTPSALSSVLEQADARATEMVANLQNFTAQEKIEYQSLGHMAITWRMTRDV